MGAAGEGGPMSGDRVATGAGVRTAGAWLVAASLAVSGGIVAMVVARQAQPARPPVLGADAGTCASASPVAGSEAGSEAAAAPCGGGTVTVRVDLPRERRVR